jgi:CheY-like chemotaxis protein
METMRRSPTAIGTYVLVVDDDSVARTLFADLLRDGGYSVEEARGGLEALAAMRRCPPCIVLLDLVMPGPVDGWGVLLEMQLDAALAWIPVCVVSGADVHGLPATIRVLTKPVTFDAMRVAVEAHCGKP